VNIKGVMLTAMSFLLLLNTAAGVAGGARGEHRGAMGVLRTAEERYDAYDRRKREETLCYLRRMIPGYAHSGPRAGDLMGMALESRHPDIRNVALDAVEGIGDGPAFEGDRHWRRVVPAKSVLAFRDLHCPMWTKIRRLDAQVCERIVRSTLAAARKVPHILEYLGSSSMGGYSLFGRMLQHVSPELVESVLPHINPNYIEGCRCMESDNGTLFSSAVRGGRIELVRMFLGDSRLDPNVPTDMMRFTPLHFAVECGDVEMVKLLLDDGRVEPDPPANQWDGRTPLAEAQHRGNNEIAHMIEEAIARRHGQRQKRSSKGKKRRRMG